MHVFHSQVVTSQPFQVSISMQVPMSGVAPQPSSRAG